MLKIPISRFFVAVYLILIISFPASAHEKLKLDNLINEAIKNNPEIKELSNKYYASQLRKPQEKALEDPMLGIGLMDIPLNVPAFGPNSFAGASVSLSQKIPYPEKLTLKGNMAEINSGMVKTMLNEKINEIKKRAKIAYFELFFVNKSIAITLSNKELLKDFTKIAESRYIVGTGMQLDIIKANIGLSKLGQNLIELNQQKLNLKYEINNLLYRLPSTETGEPADVKLSSLKYGLKDLEVLALRRSPMVKRTDYQIDMSEHENHLARLDYIPDFEFSLNYHTWSDRADLVSGMLSVNLPVWYKDKQNNKVKETQFNIIASKQERKVVFNNILLNIARLSTEINKDRELYDLLKNGIIPQTNEALKSGIISYQSGKSDFLSLRDSQISLLNYEMDSVKSLVEHEKGIAELEFEIGSELVKR